MCYCTYDSGWIVMNEQIQKNIIILMMRSKKFCTITAGGFVDVSLTTFAGVRQVVITLLQLKFLYSDEIRQFNFLIIF